MTNLERLLLDVRQQQHMNRRVYEGPLGDAYVALELAGEAGEVADTIKKAHRAGVGLTNEVQQDLRLELGDTLWALVSACARYGTSLEDVAGLVLAKLETRRGGAK